MKTKNKMIVLLEIAIVLCSVFLAATPAIAADQNQEMQKVTANTITTASEDDYVLGIYGNANEDDTIDMRDLTYVKLIFFGKKPETELADAKYDGKINPLDFIQIKLIIVGKEKEMTIVDSADRIVTVNKPVNRIVVTFSQLLELLRTVKLGPDRIVGAESVFYTGKTLSIYKIFFPEFIDLPSVGTINNPDVEAILNLHPDVALLPAQRWCASKVDPAQDVLESAGITVLRIYGGGGPSAGKNCVEEAEKFGYIFDKREEADEFIDFYEGWINLIKERVEDIPEEDKPKVYVEAGYGGKKYVTISDTKIHAGMAGGENIFGDKKGSVDPEAVIERDPDIIVIAIPCGGYDLDAGDTAELEKIREEMMTRPELLGVTAVKEGRVYVISGYILCTRGEYSACCCLPQIAYMAKWFHPALFEDLYPRTLQQEYLTRFQGLDIDLDKKGVFVYQE